MKYTNLNLSNFLKHTEASVACNGVQPAMYWVNSYHEGRKDACESRWSLQHDVPKSKNVRFYPAYTIDDFIEKIAPRLYYAPVE